jgi:retron-type reverse transcriptase
VNPEQASKVKSWTPTRRFHQLYDKVYRQDILEHAYRLAKSQNGAPGVDGVSFADIEAWGEGSWLAALGKELHDKTYRPDPVRRVMIPKPGGGERPLGIPTIRDRVVQTAAKLILEPIFEADFVDEAYGVWSHKRTLRSRIKPEAAMRRLPLHDRFGHAPPAFLMIPEIS